MSFAHSLRTGMLLISLSCTTLQAAEAPAPLFTDPTPLHFELSGPFVQIDRERDKEQEYDGTLTLNQADGSVLMLDVKYEVRGNYRLREDICNYSQLWLNLRKGQLEGTVFAGQDKLKLVVQCDNHERYAAYIAREEQIYRLFNVLSPLSFLSRKAVITYTDPASARATRTHTGFLIEHQENLAARLALEEVKIPKAAVRELDAQQANLVAVFMFMVSNTDYSLLTGPEGEDCCHNAKLFAETSGVYHPAPYDFDSTGYVNASYATPSEGLRQNSVRDRVYRGFCVDDSILQGTLALFNDKRAALYAIVREESVQNERDVERTVEYLDEFFTIINDSKKLQREIVDKCRG